MKSYQILNVLWQLKSELADGKNVVGGQGSRVAALLRIGEERHSNCSGSELGCEDPELAEVCGVGGEHILSRRDLHSIAVRNVDTHSHISVGTGSGCVEQGHLIKTHRNQRRDWTVDG